jgi:Protein of unknown function (DUF664)
VTRMPARPPTASSLSLLGLLKHCALWERRWFQVAVAACIRALLADGLVDELHLFVSRWYTARVSDCSPTAAQ